MYLLTEQEHVRLKEFKKLFPYKWKTIDLVIASSAGGVVGLWIGYLLGILT